MLQKELAHEVLCAALATGADFAEIFYEDTVENTVAMLSSKVDQASTRHLFGAGIRILLDTQEVYGYTSDCSREGLLALAEDLRSAFTGAPLGITFTLTEESASGVVTIDRESKDVSPAEKIGYMRIVDGVM